MSAFEDFINLELPKRPFVEDDGAIGQVLVRSPNPLAVRELVWTDFSSETVSMNVVAGEDISALRVIKLENNLAYVASSTVPGDSDKIIGVATVGALLGQPLTVRTHGPLSDAIWSWTEGALFIDEAGDISITPPASGFIQKIGKVVSPTKIIVDVNQPIMRL